MNAPHITFSYGKTTGKGEIIGIKGDNFTVSLTRNLNFSQVGDHIDVHVKDILSLPKPSYPHNCEPPGDKPVAPAVAEWIYGKPFLNYDISLSVGQNLDMFKGIFKKPEVFDERQVHIYVDMYGEMQLQYDTKVDFRNQHQPSKLDTKKYKDKLRNWTRHHKRWEDWKVNKDAYKEEYDRYDRFFKTMEVVKNLKALGSTIPEDLVIDPCYQELLWDRFKRINK